TDIENCLNSGMSSREIINLSQRNEFLSSYRTTRKALNNSITDSFQQKLDLGKCRNIYPSVGLTYITLEAKKSYINTIAAYEQVEYIDLEVEVEFVTPEAEMETTDAESTYDGYHMTNSYSYDGSGIKIGILEASGIFDANAPHLVGKSIITDLPANTQISSHATHVVSILAGNSLSTENQGTYRGIAPNAELFYSIDNDDLDEKIDWFLTHNVHIINISMGWNYDDDKDGVYDFKYRNEDKIVDKYVLDYRIVIVKSAGNYREELDEETGEIVVKNDNYVTSAGLSYNLITVGNATYNAENDIYTMRESSSYKHLDFLTNKPDMSAIGTNVHMVVSGTSAENYNIGNYKSGTSYAAPQVAGAAALVMQANVDLLYKPEVVKAILLGSANENLILIEEKINENNEVVYENEILSNSGFWSVDENVIGQQTHNLRTKSGAGLLDIEAATWMANSNLFYSYAFGPGTIADVITESYYFVAGTKIEVGLVFEKNNTYLLNEKYQNDLNIEILDEQNNPVLKTSGNINNVEIFTCVINETGSYKFRVKSDGNIQNISYGLNATFFLSCGCSEKIISHSNYSNTHNIVSCSRCGFSCQEKHRKVEISKTDSYYGITLTFTMYYLPQKYVRSTRDFNYISEFVVIATENNPNIGIETIIGSGGSNQVIATGEIITRSYEVVVANISTGNYSFPEFTVTATTDCFAQTITLS
ncbi:MAG: S8 family serine peptidase, partial [Clostridia bacterium]|nr:S8 family serine peptidase [Clostridia bacterium]